MSDAPDKESKTEEATEKKVRDSLEKGRIPYSREAATLSTMLAILIAAVFLAAGMMLLVAVTAQRRAAR